MPKKIKLTKQRMTQIIVFAVMLGGIGLMAYPFVSNYIFEHRQDSIIETYNNTAKNVDDAKIQNEKRRAQAYNESIFTNHVQLEDPFKAKDQKITKENYNTLLNLQKNGIMGYVKIPTIDVELPIYHGTSDSVLQQGVGHLEGTSLPIGGESTHCVLTGHTGLNQAKLFTDLTQVKLGDHFVLYVLDEKLAYEVDQILVVLPDDTEALAIEEKKDYCTLVTCTPYGINSHRLLVRGHRVPYTEDEINKLVKDEKKTVKSEWMRQYERALFTGIVVILLMIFTSNMIDKIRARKKQK